MIVDNTIFGNSKGRFRAGKVTWENINAYVKAKGKAKLLEALIYKFMTNSLYRNKLKNTKDGIVYKSSDDFTGNVITVMHYLLKYGNCDDIKKSDCISRSKLKLKHYQQKLVEFLQSNRGVIAAFDTGTGKTLTAVTASQCYLDANPEGKVIVVTPTSLQSNFKKEITAYGAKITDKYEFFSIQSFANRYKTGPPPSGKFMLIVDEAHELRTNIQKRRIASAKISRAEIFVRVAIKANKVLLLTATPVYNEPSDILNLLAMIKGTYPMSKTNFTRMIDRGDYSYIRDSIMIYKNPMTDDYPTFTIEDVRITMEPEFYKKYTELEEGVNSNLFGKVKNPWVFLGGMRQAVNNMKGVDSAKVKWTIDKVLEGKKTLIYSAFLSSGVKLLEEILRIKGIKYTKITGDMSKKNRDTSVKAYNDNKVQVMLITKAGGVGLDLKGTRNVVLFESSWNRPIEDQVIGRAIRYKSHSHLAEKDRTVKIYRLLLVKPEGSPGRISSDEMLNDMTVQKELVNKNFMDIMDAVSIGKNIQIPTKDISSPVTPTSYRGNGKEGDFSWMSKQPKYKDSLFVFNDNEEQYISKSCSAGGGNAVVRPLQCQNPPRALGVPTGSFKGKGYKSLTPQAKKLIDESIERIRDSIRKYRYDRIIYSVNKDGYIGTGIFNVGDDVRKYITTKLQSLSK